MKKITALLLSLTINTALASEVGYEIEVIIFEDLTGKYIDSEHWPDMSQRLPGQEYLQEEVLEPEQADKDPGYRIDFTPGENQLLKDSVTKLIEHPQFKVHVHKVWRQPGLDKDMAVPFEINSKEQILDPLQYLTENSATLKEAENQQESTSEIPPYESYVDGSVTLVMSRYLHFSTNLVLHRTVEEEIHAYPVKSERRMKSRETHYLDNPLVGVIVIATPFKILTEEDKRKPVKGYRTL